MQRSDWSGAMMYWVNFTGNWFLFADMNLRPHDSLSIINTSQLDWIFSTIPLWEIKWRRRKVSPWSLPYASGPGQALHPHGEQPLLPAGIPFAFGPDDIDHEENNYGHFWKARSHKFSIIIGVENLEEQMLHLRSLSSSINLLLVFSYSPCCTQRGKLIFDLGAYDW